MTDIARFLDVLDRAQEGTICTKKDWDRLIMNKVKEKLKEHGLEKAYNKETFVNNDLSLADSFWEAGFDLALDIGMLCTDTERVIKFTEEELKQTLKNAPSQITIGSGKDKVTFRNRSPEAKIPPVAEFGPFDVPVDEEIYLQSLMASWQYPSIDAAGPASTPLTIYGRDVRGGTPFEVLAGKYEASMIREAVIKVGRPGMPTTGANCTDTVGIGWISTYNPQLETIWSLPPSELMTNFNLLNKSAHFINSGGISHAVAHYGMLGGLPGGPEGALTSAVASMVLGTAVHQPTRGSYSVFDLRGPPFGGSSNESLWANSVAAQAESRNSAAIVGHSINPGAGPCTEMLLYEVAAQAIEHTVSGVSSMLGVRPRMGRYSNYLGTLESCFAGEIVKAAPKLNLADANEVVKNIFSRFSDKLNTPPAGKTFRECIDLKTLKASKEWDGVYRKVKKEVADLGVPLF